MELLAPDVVTGLHSPSYIGCSAGDGHCMFYNEKIAFTAHFPKCMSSTCQSNVPPHSISIKPPPYYLLFYVFILFDAMLIMVAMLNAMPSTCCKWCSSSDRNSKNYSNQKEESMENPLNITESINSSSLGSVLYDDDDDDDNNKQSSNKAIQPELNSSLPISSSVIITSQSQHTFTAINIGYASSTLIPSSSNDSNTQNIMSYESKPEPSR